MPSNPDLIVLKGIWHSMNKHPREAIELYLAAYPDYDDYFRINVLLGEEYASIENYGLAIKILPARRHLRSFGTQRRRTPCRDILRQPELHPRGTFFSTN